MAPHRVRNAVAVILFLIGAFVAHWGASVTLPSSVFGSDDELAVKMAHLEANEGRYDTLIIGSSRVYRGIDPAVLEETLADAGTPISGFNLGVPGMKAFEMFWLLERLLTPEAGIGLVIVDPETIEFDVATNVHAARTVAWHTPSNTLRALRAVAATDAPLTDRIRWAYNHLESFAAHVMSPWPTPVRNSSQDTALGSRQDGFYSLDDELAAEQGADIRKRAAGFAAAPEEFDVMVASLVEPDEIAPLTPDERRFLEDLTALVTRSGARIVFIQTPGPRASWWLEAARLEGIIDTLLSFDDPTAYPELYDRAVWFDLHHLNAEGAARFSTDLGRALVPIVGSP